MSVIEFFNQKHIFITGGTGFLGKVLIEKLLRSCEGIGQIYVLLRKKNGKEPEERLKTIIESSLFESLRKKNKDVFKKLVPIYGDVTNCQLGISEEDKQTIINKVNIVFHSAASVRFDDYLKDAILLNTRGTREVVNLALQIKRLDAFVYISTAYSNADRNVIEERIYPPHGDWRSAIKLAEEVDPHTLEALSLKYIDPLPNTYTFTKSLSEHVVKDLCTGKLPAVIFRPSVVVSVQSEPVVGWIDNFNGPVGLLTAGGKGVLRTIYGNQNSNQDYIPVDITIKMLILAAHQRASNRNLNEVAVYNAAMGDVKFTFQNLIDLGSNLTWEAPSRKLLWYPSFSMTNNWYLYFTTFLVYQMLPALLTDGLLKLLGKKPMLVKIQRKIYIANMALIYFLQKTKVFVNNRASSLSSNVLDCEKNIISCGYAMQPSAEEIYTFIARAKIGGLKELFNEEFDRDIGLRITRILWTLDRILHFTIYGISCWILLIKINIFAILINNFLLYWDNL